MKKFLILFIAVLFVNIPVYAQDASAVPEVSEDLVARAKEVCSISDDYKEFSVASLHSEGDFSLYSLEWSDDDRDAEVRIGDDSIVYGFRSFDNTDENTASEKVYSDSESKETAEAFLKEALLEKYDTLEYKGLYNEGSRYRFFYSISDDGIPYYDKYASVYVNKFTQEIDLYDYDISVLRSDKASFDDTRSQEDAEKAVLDNLQLGYVTKYDYDKKTFDVTTLYRPADYIYDAKTLEPVEASYTTYSANTAEDAAGAESGGSRKQLTQAEIKGLEESKNLLPPDKAVSVYNSIFGKNISPDDVDFSYRKEDYSSNYIISINHESENDDSFSASFDISGRLVSYYYYAENVLESSTEPDKEKEKKAAQDFINKLDINYELTDVYENGAYYSANVKRNGLISFDEKVSLSLDKNMKVSYFSARYYPDKIYEGLEEVKTEKAQALAKAEEKYPLAPYFLLSETQDKVNKVQYRTIPVYAYDKAFAVNALTGDITGRDGSELRDDTGIHAYTDLSDQWYAQFAEDLTYMGFYFHEDAFRGDDYLKLSEFREFMNGSSFAYSDPEGLFKDRKDDSLLTRYDIVKTLTKGYEDITKYTSIFVNPYDDVDDEYRGSVAILKAMGIITDVDRFRGNDNITRGEFAAIFCRYLKAQNNQQL